MSPETIATLVAGGGSALISLITAVAIGSYKTRDLVAQIEDKTDEKIVALQEHLEEESRIFNKMYGDTLNSIHEAVRKNDAALHEKIRQVELFNRDTFVRHAEFENSVKSINRAIEMLGAKMDSGVTAIRSDVREELRRLEGKINGKRDEH